MYDKMKIALLFSFVLSAFAIKNLTIWQNLQQSSNSTLFFSILNSTALDHVKSILNSTSLNSTLFVPLDSYVIGGPLGGCNFLAADSAQNKTLNATLTDFIQYQIANGTYLPTPSSGVTVIPSYLSNSALVNLEPSSTFDGAQVVVLNEYANRNSSSVSDGLIPAAKVISVGECSNGAIVYVNRPLAIPRNLDLSLKQNGLYEFRTLLKQQNILNAANSTSAITVFALSNSTSPVEGQIQANSYIVNGTYYDFNSQNTTLTSWNGTSLEISALGNNRIAVNGTLVMRPQILLSNGVMYVLDAAGEENMIKEDDQSSWYDGDDDWWWWHRRHHRRYRWNSN